MSITDLAEAVGVKLTTADKEALIAHEARQRALPGWSFTIFVTTLSLVFCLLLEVGPISHRRDIVLYALVAIILLASGWISFQNYKLGHKD